MQGLHGVTSVYKRLQEVAKGYRGLQTVTRGYRELKHLATAPWHIGQFFHDVDDQAHAWHLLMNSTLDDLAPVKRMRVRDNDVA